MTLQEQVLSQAGALLGELTQSQQALLRVLCSSVIAALKARLKDGIYPEDCREVFVAAASLHAAASMKIGGLELPVQEFRAGDLTLRQDSAATELGAMRLQKQAEQLMAPYLRDHFAFLGV